MSDSAVPIGVLGGTFDPVHHGHLRAALEALERCRLGRILFMPAGNPVHRPQPSASGPQRMEMLRRAVAAEARFTVDDREMKRPGPSYSVDTLKELRAEVGTAPLCLILGADAFLGLPSWHRWREITDLAHVIVMHRPGWTLGAQSEELQKLVAHRLCADMDALLQPCGSIRIQEMTALDISSSAIRSLVAGGGDPRFLVPDQVRDIIINTGCYRSSRPEVSMEVQRRA
jgi:nicotinate-nucleotide adenylyltransferase